VCRGSSLCCSSFGLVVCALCLSMVFVLDVSSRCPCLRGPRLVLLQVILLFAFPLAFDRLLEFLLVVSFPFSYSLWLPKCVCVVNAHIKWEIESLCDLRTGGWSLPGVMSD
jgi:hypothetical protein